MNTAHGSRTQYYHRLVAASLVGEGFHLFVDVEPQEKGENEVATALRLIRRIRATMPRSFDVVAADALYADSGFFRAIRGMGKDVIAVLKNEERDLMQDARSVFEMIEPKRFEWSGARIEVADSEGFKSWPTLGLEVRVVRSRETRRVKRQLSGQFEVEKSEWYWVTTLSRRSASSAAVVEIGHSRWKIENEGFNEAANHWGLDHVYRHDPTALLALWLLGILAYDVAHTFYRRDLKPERREKTTLRMIIELVKSDLLGPTARAHAPP